MDVPKDWLTAPPDQKANDNLKVAGFVFVSTVCIVGGLTAPFVFTRSKLPYMATPKKKIERALVHLQKGHKGNSVFVDLGSGDGEAVYQAAKLGYRAIGLELNFSLWAFSTLRRRLFFTSDERANSKILWANMFDYHLTKDFKADTVMIFGVSPLMKTISKKLQDECAPGTHVLSYRFGIPSAIPEEPALLQSKIIYDKQEMRIYEKLASVVVDKKENLS